MHKYLCLFSLFFISTITAGNCQTAAVGDLNGNGNLDVVAWNGSNISVLLNDGAGNLTGAHFLATSKPAQSVQLADFNNDGHLDILVGETLSPGLVFEILFGDGTGAFSAPVTVSLGGLIANTNPVAGDFNGDGSQDIAFSDGGANTAVQILFGDGKGGFSAPHADIIAFEGAFIGQLFVVDANHDTQADLLVTGGSARQNLCLLSGGEQWGGIYFHGVHVVE